MKETNIPTCTIIFSQLGFFFRDEDGTFLGDHKLDFVTDEMLKSLAEMCAYYVDLDIIGYYDEPNTRFVITEVINNFDGSKLTDGEVIEMFYIGFFPECIDTIINLG